MSLFFKSTSILQDYYVNGELVSRAFNLNKYYNRTNLVLPQASQKVQTKNSRLKELIVYFTTLVEVWSLKHIEMGVCL